MLTAANITIQFGAKPLFENINAKFDNGNRYGLIGANGCGKSTLMKILGGDLEPSSGTVIVDPNVRLGKLSQDQFSYENYRVLDVVMMGHKEMWGAMTERDALYANPEATDEDYMRAAELEAVYAEYGGYEAEAKAGELLLGAGIPIEQHNGLMSEIAPGWKLRVLLAQALFSKPDVLLLDEPTNNLDINTIAWLEDVLNEYESTMIIISHDRHFLNAVCTHMADLDYGTLQVVPGNYDDYMLAAAQARERTQAANARAKERIADLQDFVRRFAANKSKARQATSRQKQIEKIKSETVVLKPSSRQNPFIRFEQTKKMHRLAVELDGVSQTYTETPVIKNLNIMIEAGDKVGIVGGNGMGKSTLIKLLAGVLEPTQGLVKWSETANLGYMAQDVSDEFQGSQNLTEWVERFAKEGDDDQAIRSILGRLLFSQDDITKQAKVCSGGEKNRLVFGRLMLGRHNVLLLDEPTNHLDMESIESLQYALEKFEGTLFVVSHDRQFIEGIATRIIDMREEGITDYRGTFDEYRQSQGLR